jgi:hypothetical protein
VPDSPPRPTRTNPEMRLLVGHKAEDLVVRCVDRSPHQTTRVGMTPRGPEAALPQTRSGVGLWTWPYTSPSPLFCPPMGPRKVTPVAHHGPASSSSHRGFLCPPHGAGLGLSSSLLGPQEQVLGNECERRKESGGKEREGIPLKFKPVSIICP